MCKFVRASNILLNSSQKKSTVGNGTALFGKKLQWLAPTLDQTVTITFLRSEFSFRLVLLCSKRLQFSSLVRNACQFSFSSVSVRYRNYLCTHSCFWRSEYDKLTRPTTASHVWVVVERILRPLTMSASKGNSKFKLERNFKRSFRMKNMENYNLYARFNISGHFSPRTRQKLPSNLLQLRRNKYSFLEPSFYQNSCIIHIKHSMGWRLS